MVGEKFEKEEEERQIGRGGKHRGTQTGTESASAEDGKLGNELLVGSIWAQAGSWSRGTSGGSAADKVAARPAAPLNWVSFG